MEDFLYLCESPRRFLVGYIFKDFFKPVDPDSIDLRADMVEKTCQKYIAGYESNQMEDYGSEIKRSDPRTVFEFRYQNRVTFWFNGKQLDNGLREGSWKKYGTDKLIAEITLNGSDLLLNGNYIFPELLNLEYIMSSPLSERAFESGKYSFEHL